MIRWLMLGVIRLWRSKGLCYRHGHDWREWSMPRYYDDTYNGFRCCPRCGREERAKWVKA